MKMQVAFRDTGHVQNGFRTVIATGLMERPTDSPAADGRIATFMMDMAESEGRSFPLLVRDLDESRVPVDGWGREAGPETAVPDMVTSGVWRAPLTAGAFEAFLRATAVEPSRAGLDVFAFAGLVALAPGSRIDPDSVYELSGRHGRYSLDGRIGHDVRPHWPSPAMEGETRGEALAAFLRHPTWGFREEPVGVGWHMSLALAERFDRYQELALMEARGPGEEAEHAALRREMASQGLDNLDRDATFRDCMRTLAAKGLVPRTSAPQTRAGIEEREAVMTEFLRQSVPGMA